MQGALIQRGLRPIPYFESQGAADERPSEWLTVSSKGLLVLVALNRTLPLAGQALHRLSSKLGEGGTCLAQV
jgi:hypothetical protein